MDGSLLKYEQVPDEMFRFLELWYNGVERPFRGVFATPTISEEAQRYVETVDRDGAVLISEFLSPDVFSEVRSAYEEILGKAIFKPAARTGFECYARLHEASVRLNVDGASLLERIVQQHFLNSRLLNEIAAGVLRRRIQGIDRRARLTTLKSVNATCQDVSRANEFHYETPKSCLRLFYYLHDIDEQNGAFIYAKSSQRLSIARSWWVYRQIVLRNCCRLLRRDSFECTIVSQEDAELLKLQPSTMTGKENSLVIWDTKGFHKRGSFQDFQIRKMLEISYD